MMETMRFLLKKILLNTKRILIRVETNGITLLERQIFHEF